ncbi:MAG: hypothetical protein KDE19_00405 [Caldilineaceae bacterium]|nr:hypothetical protein [Caldilineaceae bacterium]
MQELLRRLAFGLIVDTARQMTGVRLHPKARYSLYLYGPRWFIIRNLRVWWDGWSCVDCGRRYPLQVHHTSYRHKGKGGLPGMLWEFIDCKTLCDDCHAKEHRETR